MTSSLRVSPPSSAEISLRPSAALRRISATTEISSVPPSAREAFLRPVAEEKRRKPRRISATSLVLLLASVSAVYVLLYLLSFSAGRG